MYDRLFPSAEVRADMAYLLREIKETLARAEHHQQEGAELFRKLGLLLLNAKENVGHGNWGDFLRANLAGRSEREVRRWMRLAKSDAASDLNEQWRIICGHSDAEEELVDASQTTFELIYCRPCRTTGVKPNCPNCLAIREEKAKKAAQSHDTAANDSHADQERDRQSHRQRRSRESGDEEGEPEPPPWAVSMVKAAKAVSSLGQHSADLCRMVDMPAANKSALRQAVDVASEKIEECKHYGPVKPRPVREATCDRCNCSIIWATTESRKPIALEKARKNGKFNIIDDIATPAQDGQYCCHWIKCPPIKEQSTSDEPIP
jgi:hypothetical protein